MKLRHYYYQFLNRKRLEQKTEDNEKFNNYLGIHLLLAILVEHFVLNYITAVYRTIHWLF